MKVDEGRIIGMITGLPEVDGWREYLDLFTLERTSPNVDWQLPVVACQAVGGEEEAALIGAAAIACMQISIIMVDDLLDEDPQGLFHRIGRGQAANLAFALQSAAHRIVAGSELEPSRVKEVNQGLARMALVTARGQSMDVQNRGNEEDYWQVVRTKSTPFYGFALELGSLLGGADRETQAAFYEMGELVGEVVQIHDDLFDAFRSPPSPDWNRPENNLCILYALTTDHPQRQDLTYYCQDVEAGDRLENAQQILIESGAVSYCVYQLLHRHNFIGDQIDDLNLFDTTALLSFLEDQKSPVIALASNLNLDIWSLSSNP